MERVAPDFSNGFDALSGEFKRRRSPTIGVTTVRRWSRRLPPGGTVLDLGCGDGAPISQALVEDGFVVFGVDSAPSMVAAFQERLPGVPVVCEPVETSSFFDRQFDGVVAWGLVFLLPIDAQLALIHRIGSVLEPGGSLLFTAPEQVCQWRDSLTGRQSASPGADAYRATLSEAGLALVGEYEDEGNNHYFDATKP